MAGVIAGVSVAMMVVIGAVVSVVARRSASSYVPPNITIPSDPNLGSPGAEKQRVALSDLHTTPLDWMHDVPIEKAGMVGTLERFDALANWDWALKVGHSWWEDAQMFGLSIDPVEKGGTANLTGTNARVDYHLVSLACRKDQKKRAETEKVKEASCSLELTIDKDGPSVRLDLIAVDQGGRANALAKPACTIAQVFDNLESSKRLTKRPSYSIRLDHDVFGLNYTVRNGNGAASMDGLDVSPTFCAPKPTTTKPTTATTTTTTTTTAGELDRGALTKALKAADLASCKAKAGPTGSGRATLTFAPNGTVTKVAVAPPYEGTEKGTCVQMAYGTVRVPPFSGSPTNVTTAFTLVP
jgi:hypothetical protein